MTHVIGIDPGRNGAIAVLDLTMQDGCYRVTTHDMPDTTAGVLNLLLSLPKALHAGIEKPFYPQHVGTKHVAVMAENFGALKAALLFCGIPAYETRPAEWKAALNLNANKAASREMASAIFPDDTGQWPLVKHDGRAEAALIAWYSLKWRK